LKNPDASGRYVTKSAPVGKAGENTDTVKLLMTALDALGVGTNPFPQLHLPPTSAKIRMEPDLELTRNGHHFVSAKKGQNQVNAAFTSAVEYQVELPSAVELRGEQVGEVFAVTYPRDRDEQFLLIALPRRGRHDTLPFSPMGTAEEVAIAIKSVIDGDHDSIRRSLESPSETAKRMLLGGAEVLARTIHRIPDASLESIFGGKDFFESVLSRSLNASERKEALRMGPAFLFVNQLFFYTLLAQSYSGASDPPFKPIAREDRALPLAIDTNYFAKVRSKDYWPVYGIRVAGFFQGDDAAEACSDIVGAFAALAPELEGRDIAGQVFQTLIPLGIRKPLGAHYTNLNAASLLASLAIDDPQATVLDPACGSGTLLVAAYRRKLELTPETLKLGAHKKFVEEQLTGIDAMAFSAHLAAVNLAIQRPLTETDRVNIGTGDSSRMKPGDSVSKTSAALSDVPVQLTLEESEGHGHALRTRKKRGPIPMRGDDQVDSSFKLAGVDLVITNPPFTSWGHMSKEYRDHLRRYYRGLSAEFEAMITYRPSQQLFFLLLADRFLRRGQRLAAVVPLTTFTVRAFHLFTKWFLQHYSLDFVILGMGRASFSEDTALTECMLVATKGPPSASTETKVLGVADSPDRWDGEKISAIYHLSRSDENDSIDGATLRVVPQSQFSPNAKSLTGIYLELDKTFRDARANWEQVVGLIQTPFLPFGRFCSETGVDTTGGLRTTEHLSFYGPAGLIVCRSVDRATGKSDHLVYGGQEGATFRCYDKSSQVRFEYPASSVKPAIRRFTNIGGPDVSGTSDFCLWRPEPELAKILGTYYAPDFARKYSQRVRRTSPRWPGGRWAKRVDDSSSRLVLVRRIDLSAPGTTALSIWGPKSLFVACEGYAVTGVGNPVQEKMLCMWFNSSFFLLEAIGHVTVTRGTWVKFEQFGLELARVPDVRRLTALQEGQILELWSKVNRVSWPALVTQLEGGTEQRTLLDEGLLRILGVGSEAIVTTASESARLGLKSIITGLVRTMGMVEDDEDDAEE
jgi:hypothetical protein